MVRHDQVDSVSDGLVDRGAHHVNDEADVLYPLAARADDETDRVPLFRPRRGPKGIELVDDLTK